MWCFFSETRMMSNHESYLTLSLVVAYIDLLSLTVHSYFLSSDLVFVNTL